MNDLAQAHILSIEALGSGAPTDWFNVGTGRGNSVREVLNAVEAVTGRKVPHTVGPRRKTPVKEIPYESGMDPIGDARQRFDVKFYLIAILFLVFDVELLFLYPWAVAAYHDPRLIPVEMRNLVFWEVLVFLGTLAVAD